MRAIERLVDLLTIVVSEDEANGLLARFLVEEAKNYIEFMDLAKRKRDFTLIVFLFNLSHINHIRVF